eukprot:Gb_39733 [translate_table: standard]
MTLNPVLSFLATSSYSWNVTVLFPHIHCIFTSIANSYRVIHPNYPTNQAMECLHRSQKFILCCGEDAAEVTKDSLAIAGYAIGTVLNIFKFRKAINLAAKGAK